MIENELYFNLKSEIRFLQFKFSNVKKFFLLKMSNLEKTKKYKIYPALGRPSTLGPSRLKTDGLYPDQS
jgi:hypothetical protein